MLKMTVAIIGRFWPLSSTCCSKTANLAWDYRKNFRLTGILFFWFFCWFWRSSRYRKEATPTFESYQKRIRGKKRSATGKLSWESVAQDFQWKKNGITYWSMIFISPKWNGLRVRIEHYGKLSWSPFDRKRKPNCAHLGAQWSERRIEKFTYRELYENVCHVANMLRTGG